MNLAVMIFWFSGPIVLIADHFISLQIKEMALSYFRQIKTMNFAFLFDYFAGSRPFLRAYADEVLVCGLGHCEGGPF